MNIKNMSTSAIKGAVISLILTLIIIIGVSIFMLFKDVATSTFNIIFIAINSVSIVIGAVVATRINEENGWLVGLLVSIIYYLIIALISFFLGAEGFSFSLTRFGIFMIMGVLSGMLGVNL